MLGDEAYSQKMKMLNSLFEVVVWVFFPHVPTGFIILKNACWRERMGCVLTLPKF